MIGKYLNLYPSKPPVPPGWSEWHAAAPVGFPTEEDTFSVYNYTVDENGTSVHYGQNPADFKQDVLTRKGINFVNRRAPKAQPFFLWLTYTAPHIGGPNPNPNPPFDCNAAAKPAPRHAHAFDSAPLPTPPNFNEADVSDKPAAIRNLPRLTASQIADNRRKYRCALESLMSVDEGVKRVIDALRSRGELGNTLLIYTSDNGFFNGEHRVPRSKQRIYEESIRVPLEMRGPGIPHGVSISQLSINADLAPTIVDAADASPGLVMDGRSLIPVAAQPGIATGRELLIENPAFQEQPSFTAIRTGRYMYAEHNSGEKELYDLQTDPFELQSRHNAPAYASVKSQLAARLHQLQNCAGTDCWAQP
jgi:N-acetylglucosamine-6-sulfatase